MTTKMKWLALFSSLALTSCGGSNYFKEAASKDSNEALYEDALKLIDQADYTGAINKFSQMSSDAQNSSDVQRSLAGAYAGRCGLNFLDFVSNIGGSGAPFSMFMSGFTNRTVAPTDCYTSQLTIESRFGDTAVTRTASNGTSQGNSLNFFMAILGMSKIGTNLRSVADADQDGSVDAGFDACLNTSITDDEVKQVGTGFAMVLDNFTAISSTLDPATSTLIDGISTTCAALTPNPCVITDPTSASWDAAAILAFRSLIKSNTIGIQNCSADNGLNPLPFPFDCCP